MCVWGVLYSGLKSQVYEVILLRQSVFAFVSLCAQNIYAAVSADAAVIAGISVSLFFMLFG